MDETTPKRKLASSTATELAKLVDEIGMQDVAREVGFTAGALYKMIAANETRPVVENWARLYREARAEAPASDYEIIFCRVEKAKAQQLTDFVTLMLKGRALRFVDR